MVGGQEEMIIDAIAGIAKDGPRQKASVSAGRHL
jgi:hypothetical protein